MVKPIILAAVMSLLLDVCGYHQAGKGRSLPANIRTLAVPVFQNTSLKYRVEQRFTQAVIDEILKRGRALNVTTNPDDADAVLLGDIRNFRTAGAILDAQGRSRVWDLTITVRVTLKDMKTRKVLYDNPRLIFQGEYQLSDDPKSFFNESNAAVDRIAKDFAQSIVSALLEGM